MKKTKEEILKIVFRAIDEFHSTTCFWTHTKNLKQTIINRLNDIEVKVKHKRHLGAKNEKNN